MSDDTEKFFELRDSVLRDAQIYQDAASRPVPGSARDAFGVIDVALEESGALTVTIADAWRSSYDPGELAGGVLQTFQELAAARTAAWVTNLGDALEGERPNIPSPSASETVAGKLKAALDDEPDSGAEMTRVLENLLGFLEDVTANFDSSFDEAVRRGRATHASDPGSRHVSVEMSATGDLHSVHFAEDWVSAATGTQITRELNAAIAHARAAGERDGARPLDGTALGKYQRYLDDPDSFVSFVRGKE